MVWKTPRAVRQLSGSEEKGDIDPCLSLQLCPSRLGSLLFLESKAVQRPRPSAYHCPRTWLVAGGGRVRGLGCLADEEKPHTSLWKEGTEQGRPVHDPHPWHRPRHGHRGSQAKAQFIYTCPTAHDLGLEDRSWGEGLKATEDSAGVQGKRDGGQEGSLQCPPRAPMYPRAEAEMQSHSGFGLGYSKSNESSQSGHAQGHASNNGHAH